MAADSVEAMPMATAQRLDMSSNAMQHYPACVFAWQSGRMMAAILHAASPSASVAANRTPIEASFASTFCRCQWHAPRRRKGLLDEARPLRPLRPDVELGRLQRDYHFRMELLSRQASLAGGRLIFLDLLNFLNRCSH